MQQEFDCEQKNLPHLESFPNKGNTESKNEHFQRTSTSSRVCRVIPKDKSVTDCLHTFIPTATNTRMSAQLAKYCFKLLPAPQKNFAKAIDSHSSGFQQSITRTSCLRARRTHTHTYVRTHRHASAACSVFKSEKLRQALEEEQNKASGEKQKSGQSLANRQLRAFAAKPRQNASPLRRGKVTSARRRQWGIALVQTPAGPREQCPRTIEGPGRIERRARSKIPHRCLRRRRETHTQRLES